MIICLEIYLIIEKHSNSMHPMLSLYYYFLSIPTKIHVLSYLDKSKSIYPQEGKERDYNDDEKSDKEGEEE
jgi:hypothetical protein